MLDLGSAVGYLLLDTKDFQTNINKAEAGFKSFFDNSNKFGNKMKGLSSGLTTVGTAMTTGLTLPILGAGATMVTVGGQFESALSNIQSQTRATDEEMEGLKQVLDNIYRNNYGEGYDDIAESISKVKIALGEVSDEELQKTTESALVLRDVFGVDVSESIRAAQSLMKNFNLTSEQAFDMITEGFQNGLDFSGEFIDTLNEYPAQFVKLGLSAEDMFRIMQTGADTGAWNLDKIGDAMKELSIRVIDGSNTTIEGFEAIGLNADEMANKFAAGGESAREALLETVDALANMEDPLQQNIAGVNLFGTMWEDLGPEVVLQMANIRDASYETAGAMDELKATKYDNLKSDLESLGRSFITIAKNLGTILVPYIREFVGMIQNLVDNFVEMDESTQKVILVIAGIVAAIGPLLLIFGKLAGAISAISGLIAGAGGLSAILTALTGPIGIVIGAVAALVVAWTTNFGGIRDATANIFASIQSIISSVLNIIVGLWQSNFANIQGIFTAVFSTLEAVVNYFFTMLQDVFNIFAVAFAGDWEAVWEGVKTLFIDWASGIIEILLNLLNLIIQTILGIIGGVVDAVNTVFYSIANAFVSGWNAIMNWFLEAVNDPVKAITDIGQALFDAGAAIFTSLWDGLKSVWDTITGWVEDCINWLADKLAFWESESDKLDTRTSGRSSGYHSSGLDYVPYNGYRAVLHEGEAVLTKEENKNRNKNSSGDTFVFYSPEPIDEVTAAREFRKVKKEIAEDLLK